MTGGARTRQQMLLLACSRLQTINTWEMRFAQTSEHRVKMPTPSLLAQFSGMRADWSPIARLNVPSKLACCFLKRAVNSSPTARFKEHRRPNNTINPVCALGEQGRRITAIPVSASTGDQQPSRAPIIPKLACSSHTEQPGSVQMCAREGAPPIYLINGPSKLASYSCPLRMWMSAALRLAMDAWPVVVFAVLAALPGHPDIRPFTGGDGETQCSKVRSA